jgi:hypothetical protein
VQKGGKDGPDCTFSKIHRAFRYRDRHVFIRLYVQYVRPHIEFAVPAWSPWLEANKEVLEKVQRRAIQMVSGLKAHTYEDRLKALGLTTFEERRHQADMAQTYKIVKGKAVLWSWNRNFFSRFRFRFRLLKSYGSGSGSGYGSNF